MPSLFSMGSPILLERHERQFQSHCTEFHGPETSEITRSLVAINSLFVEVFFLQQPPTISLPHSFAIRHAFFYFRGICLLRFRHPLLCNSNPKRKHGGSLPPSRHRCARYPGTRTYSECSAFDIGLKRRHLPSLAAWGQSR